MMMIATSWLAVVLAGMAWWTVRDRREYAAFKLVEDSVARRAFYRRWTWQSFVLLVGATVVTLAILGAGDALFRIPPVLGGIADALASSDDAADATGDRRKGFLMGAAIGISILVIVQVRRAKKMMSPVIGDVEPLIPRNRAEMLAALPLCINAGLSEELFFRLALPLLIAHVTGFAVVGLAAAAMLFGLIHAYQGWKGVLATTVVGGMLTLVYLKSGSIVQPIMLHALMDVVALIVRPWISGRIADRLHRRTALLGM